MRRNWAHVGMGKWNIIFEFSKNTRTLGKACNMTPLFRTFFPENFCSIQFHSSNFPDFWLIGNHARLSLSPLCIDPVSRNRDENDFSLYILTKTVNGLNPGLISGSSHLPLTND